MCTQGTAAEDIFVAYVYYAMPSSIYQTATSCIKASAFISHLLSGLLGDILVTQFEVDIKILFYISTVFVTFGMIIGLYIIRPVEVMYNSDGTVRRSTLTIPIMEHMTEENIDDVGVSMAATSNPMMGKERKAIHDASDKWKYIRKQISQIHEVFKSKFLLAFTIWWVGCNAVWMTLYDYEVAIYEELNGSNNWNGSILSLMLVAGLYNS